MGRIKAREEEYQAAEASIAQVNTQGGLSIQATADSEGVACSTLHGRCMYIEAVMLRQETLIRV